MQLKIEVLCTPCQKCTLANKNIQQALKLLALKADFKHITDFREFSKYSANVAQMPVVLINGAVEFAGEIHYDLLCRKLAEITQKPMPNLGKPGSGPYQMKQKLAALFTPSK